MVEKWWIELLDPAFCVIFSALLVAVMGRLNHNALTTAGLCIYKRSRSGLSDVTTGWESDLSIGNRDNLFDSFHAVALRG